MIGSARFSRSYGFTHGSIELQPADNDGEGAKNEQTADAHGSSSSYSFSIDRICVR